MDTEDLRRLTEQMAGFHIMEKIKEAQAINDPELETFLSELLLIHQTSKQITTKFLNAYVGLIVVTCSNEPKIAKQILEYGYELLRKQLLLNIVGEVN